jgi:hypothetical protein
MPSGGDSGTRLGFTGPVESHLLAAGIVPRPGSVADRLLLHADGEAAGYRRLQTTAQRLVRAGGR